MIYPNISVEAWSQKHGIFPPEYQCKECGKTFIADKPIIVEGLAGYEGRHEGCDGGVLILTPRTPQSRKTWADIAREFFR